MYVCMIGSEEKQREMVQWIWIIDESESLPWHYAASSIFWGDT